MGITTKGNGRVVFGSSSSIITDGLEFYVDAANPMSYVSGSTTVNDLVSGNDGTLTNGIGFDNKSWVFDEIDEYINIGDAISSKSLALPLTFELWVNVVDNANNLNLFTTDTSPPYYGVFVQLSPSVGGERQIQINIGDGTGGSVGDRRTAQSGNILPTNEITQITIVLNDLTDVDIYINSIISSTPTYSGTGGPIAWSGGNGYIGNFNNSLFLDSTVGIMKVYGRGLTQKDIQQNYNALKGRFGL